MSRVTPLLVLALLLAALLPACSQAPRGDLRFALSAAPVTLDPRLATDATSARINRLLYRALVDFDARFQPVPELARWEVITPTHYRFTLGEAGRRFHDGSRLTAADVQATYASVLDPATASPHRADLSLIERMEVLDEDRIDFHLSRPEPLFAGKLVIGILPAALVEARHPFRSRPVGSGPFRFEAWPEEGRLTLTRVADGLELTFLVVKDPTVRVLKLLRGEVDMLQGELPPELVGYLEEQPGVTVRRGRGSNFTYLGFNLEDPVTGRVGVRRAVAHAIDRQAIIAHVLNGAARPATALFPPYHWAGNPDLALIPYDPARARALLAAEGFDAEHPARIVYKTSSNPLRVRLATILQHQLGRVGMEVDLRTYDWGTFYGDIKAGNFQMYSLIWVGIKSPDFFRYVFHSEAVPPAGANRGRYRSPRVDAWVEQAASRADLAGQAALYRRIQAQLLEDLPYVPLWYEDHVFVAREGVTGYRIAPDGNYDGLVGVRVAGR